MADDIGDFIRQQKTKIANERQNIDGKQYPDQRRNGYKENIPPRGQTPEVPLVAKMLPSAENERRRKLREERKQEYNSLLQKQRAQETTRNAPDDDGGAAIPGLTNRGSAKQRKANERNREYNEFLEQQKEKERHRFDKSKGGGTSRKSEPEPDRSRRALSERQTQREPDRQERGRRLDEYDRREPDRGRNDRDYDEPPRRRHDDNDDDRRGAPPRARPDEDDGMSLPLRDRSSAKRRAEATRNQEYNDFLEKKRSGRARKGWGTPTYDEILDEKRKQERDYRRHDDPEVYGRPIHASYSDGHLNKSFEEERLDQLDRETEDKKVRFKNDLRKPPGRGLLDDRDWLDPIRVPRKYDPDQEFQEWDRNLGDNRPQIRTAGNEVAVRPANSFNDRRRAPSAPLEGGGALPLGNEAPESIARRKEQYRRELEQQMQQTAQNKRSPRGIRRDAQPTYNTAPTAYLQNQPQLGPYNTPGDESYHYYGMVDPITMGLEPSRTGAGGGGHPAVPPLYASDRAPRVTFDDSGETTRTTPRKGKYDSDMVSAAIPTVDDRDQQIEKKAKAADYQRELERQMQEQKMKKLREKAERDAYERKLEEEIRNYNPFGRGGGGAPLKDASGNVVADLRGGGNVPSQQQASQQLGGGGQIATTPRSVRTNPDPSYLTPRGTDGEPTHARGGHGIFGAPKTDAEKDATDKYKDELRLQIEERKRREDERKRLEKEEEQREQARMEAQQQKMKDEYQSELNKQKAKDDEARRQNEELKNAAENKKLALERQRHEEEDGRQDELRRGQEEERMARNREQQRGNSPPVPSLRKDDSSRIDRAGSATILNELDKMRKQLQNERHRVESSLEKDKYTVEVFDPRLAKPRPMPISQQPPVVPSTLQRPISPHDVDVPAMRGHKIDFDIFDQAIKNRVPAAVRRPHLAGDEVHPEVLDEFQKYKNKRTPSRQNFRNDFPDQPTSGFTLEAQQLALLREQEDQLNKMRRKPFDDAFVGDLDLIPPMGDMGSKSQLQSDSAFIDMDGLPINPHEYDRSSSQGSRNPSARDRRRNRETPKPSGSRHQPDNASLGSTVSLDPENIRRKNEDRLKRLNDIADDSVTPGISPAPKKKASPSQSPTPKGSVSRSTSVQRASIDQTVPIRIPGKKRTPRHENNQPTQRKPRQTTPVPRQYSNRGAPKVPPRPGRQDRSPHKHRQERTPPRPARERTPPTPLTPEIALPPPRRTARRFSPSRSSTPPPLPPRSRRSNSKSPDYYHPATMASPYRSKKMARRVPTPDSQLGHDADNISMENPDDIIDRFISKQRHNRPPSGTTLGDDDDAWLRPSK